MKITKENLSAQGWVFNQPLFEKTNHVYEQWNCSRKINGTVFHCALTFGASNIPGREWGLDVDNEVFESVGSMDVNSYEQINRFLDLLTEDKVPVPEQTELSDSQILSVVQAIVNYRRLNIHWWRDVNATARRLRDFIGKTDLEITTNNKN